MKIIPANQLENRLSVGMTYTFPNGNVMTLDLTRMPGHATWIKRRDYAFNTTTLYWHRTAYDAEGRPTETEDSLTSTRQWLYNRRSELVGATGTQAHPYDYAYYYDSIGNRLTSSDNFDTATYTANCLNQYTQVTRNQTPQNLAYDADGNLTQDERFNYAYDDENRLVSVTPRNPGEGSLAIENAYDHRSRRIKKIVKCFDGTSWNTAETHVFAWDGWNIVFEHITFADNTTRTVEYFWGNDLSDSEQGAGGVGGLLATRIDGVFYIPVYGAYGNIMMYVDETGTIAAQYDYDPYGNILQSSGPLASQLSFGFSTKYHDREVDLIAYQLRTYDPVNGRWLNRDPIEEAGGENLYCFCKNASMVTVDRLGMSPLGVAGIVLGAYELALGDITWRYPTTNERIVINEQKRKIAQAARKYEMDIASLLDHDTIGPSSYDKPLWDYSNSLYKGYNEKIPSIQDAYLTSELVELKSRQLGRINTFFPGISTAKWPNQRVFYLVKLRVNLSKIQQVENFSEWKVSCRDNTLGILGLTNTILPQIYLNQRLFKGPVDGFTLRNIMAHEASHLFAGTDDDSGGALGVVYAPWYGELLDIDL